MTRREIRKRLREDVKRLALETQLASARFNEILNDIPSCIPNSDGAQRIRNASIENAAAQTRLRRAMKREADFMLHGTVPEDLQQ
jgi:hypothetical protein